MYNVHVYGATFGIEHEGLLSGADWPHHWAMVGLQTEVKCWKLDKNN